MAKHNVFYVNSCGICYKLLVYLVISTIFFKQQIDKASHPQTLTLKRVLAAELHFRRDALLPPSGRWDAELRPAGEAAAVQHLRPGEAEGAHDGQAAVPHRLAEAPAGAHRHAELRPAHRGEERAQELAGVRVAALGEQRQPGSSLLLHLPQAVVAQQVRKSHQPVADAVAQRQAGGDGPARRPQ